MVNGTKIIGNMNDSKPADNGRKNSSANAGAFGEVFHSFQSSNNNSSRFSPSTEPDFSRSKSESATGTVTEMKKHHEKNFRSNPRDEQDEVDRRSLKGGSESGQKPQADLAESVDGCETGERPGTSTEAAVNAPLESISGLENPDNLQLSIDSVTSQATEQKESVDPDVQIFDPSPVNANPDLSKSLQQEELKVTAKPIDRPGQFFAPNMNLTDQKIIFETGLAEHFVRMLTDNFSQTKNSIPVEGETSDPEPVQPQVSSGTSSNSPSSTPMNFSAMPRTVTQDEAGEGMNRILQVIRSNIGHRQSQMTVQLDPPELGKLRMDIRLVDQNLKLTIQTETSEARQMILSRIETLKHNLEQNGIQLSKVDVVAKSADPQQSQNGQQEQENAQSRNNGGFQQQQQNSNGFNRPEEPETDLSSTEETHANPVTISSTTSPDEALNLVA